MVNPIYTLYSGYLLGISPFKVKQLGAHHPKGIAPGASRSFVGIEGELSFQVRNILVELPLRDRNTFEYVECWATSFTAHQEQLLCLTI